MEEKNIMFRIYIAEENNGVFEPIGFLEMPSMSEQISLDESGNLMVVFESDCCKYGDGEDGNGKASIQIGNVCYLSVDKIMKNKIDFLILNNFIF